MEDVQTPDPALEQLDEHQELERRQQEVEAELDEPVGPEAIDQVTHEDALAAGPLQVRVPMQEIVLTHANCRVETNPETKERVIFVGPIAFTFALPFQEETARTIARELAGGIEIASGVSAADVAAAKRLEVVR